MSSHHVIREAQEPALVLLSASLHSINHLDDLLEWSPTIICTEQSLAATLAKGIKIDVLVCNPSFLPTAQVLTTHQQPIRLITTTEGLLESILTYLIANNHHAVNVFVGENFLFEPIQTFMTQLDIVVITPQQQKYFWVAKPPLIKWLPVGHILWTSLQPTAVEGLKIIAPQSFEVQQTGLVKVYADAPFWVQLGL